MTNNLNDNIVALCGKHTSEKNNSGTDCCKNVVIIHHKDTLGRSLPRGILVNVYDSTGKVHSGMIDGNGISRHGMGLSGTNGRVTPQVRCGEISWQLLRVQAVILGAKQEAETGNIGNCENDVSRHLSEESEAFKLNSSDGYVLIKAEADGQVVNHEEPQFQLSNPLKIEAMWQNGGYECHIYATYLPPPMLLNLRFLQTCESKLKNQQINKMIEQIKLDGNAVTLFVHGYNVPLGKTGRFPTYEETVATGKVGRDTPKPPYLTPIRTDEMQIPWLHYGREDILKLIKGKELNADKLTYEEIDRKFNGWKTLSWIPHVEYYLNLAASGKDKLDKFVDWDKYSRIVGVTWSGSVASELQFFLSEIYANESGRELAKVLIKFIEAGIQINLLTHSLGARVALSALNVLGDFDGEYDEKIDNLIMWEPAVADNAFTDKYTRSMNPIAMEIFPYAHKAAKRITVLYSTEDGVVAGDKQWHDGEITGLVGGAYPKKYNKFFSLFTKGLRPIEDFFKTRHTNVVRAEYDYVQQIRRKFHCDRLGGNRDIPSECINLRANRAKIRQAIEAEA
uniref:alpha/beta hydrolase n=1 Tax=Glaesserella sp. TaxID=2094731 RepID=UPI00359FAFD3